MKFDIDTIDRNLAQAKADVDFWERAKAIFSDPRIAALGRNELPLFPSKPNYGDLKRKVYETLPPFGQHGVSVSDIVGAMKAVGYVFAAKIPGVAVNEALRSLRTQGESHVAGKEGLALLWTKGEQRETPA